MQVDLGSLGFTEGGYLLVKRAVRRVQRLLGADHRRSDAQVDLAEVLAEDRPEDRAPAC